MGDVFNILLIGSDKQGVNIIKEILLEYGNRYPLIQKSVGTTLKDELDEKDSLLASVRYYIDNKIYKLDKQYKIDEPLSPLIPLKDAHLVIGFDPHETVRRLEYISEKTLIILNSHVSREEGSNDTQSVGEIINLLDQYARITISMDLFELAAFKFNNSNLSRFILLGMVVNEFKELIHKKEILEILNDNSDDNNNIILAFELGYSLIT